MKPKQVKYWRFCFRSKSWAVKNIFKKGVGLILYLMVRKKILSFRRTLDLYHSSDSWMFLEARFSYCRRTSLRAAVRSGLAISMSTCTCCCWCTWLCSSSISCKPNVYAFCFIGNFVTKKNKKNTHKTSWYICAAFFFFFGSMSGDNSNELWWHFTARVSRF